VSPELRQECIEVVEALIAHLEDELAVMGGGIEGQPGKDVERADRLVAELKRL
jgi:hypothetical protein